MNDSESEMSIKSISLDDSRILSKTILKTFYESICPSRMRSMTMGGYVPHKTTDVDKDGLGKPYEFKNFDGDTLAHFRLQFPEMLVVGLDLAITEKIFNKNQIVTAWVDEIKNETAAINHVYKRHFGNGPAIYYTPEEKKIIFESRERKQQFATEKRAKRERSKQAVKLLYEVLKEPIDL